MKVTRKELLRIDLIDFLNYSEPDFVIRVVPAADYGNGNSRLEILLSLGPGNVA